MDNKRKNRLAEEQSAYLLQHATNPVDWVPWDEDYFTSAKRDNKLIIVSIGYAACHWCHVMESESFEDTEVADYMNEHFVCIKVDREERPDIDHVYMNALQLLTGQGGWPLNMVTLPNGRPVWGGTYFPKKDWLNALHQLMRLHHKTPERLTDYAEQLSTGMREVNQSVITPIKAPLLATDKALEQLHQILDTTHGGTVGAPKFMMPSLIRLTLSTEKLRPHGHLTLKKIALGGIFDLLGGGFSRYAVDEKWHIPHFEKMAYDNGQLLQEYALGYQQHAFPLYREVIDKTIGFLDREMKSPRGGYYAAMDADSIDQKEQLSEGAYYTWPKETLERLGLLKNKVLCDYFGINQNGLWENDQYVFYRSSSADDFMQERSLDTQFLTTIKQWESILLAERNKRSRPIIDDKILCGWNAMIGQGFIKVAQATNEKKYWVNAKKHLAVMHHFDRPTGGLFRWRKKNKKHLDGFLEDYAATIAFYLDAYELFFDPALLLKAEQLTDYCLQHFASQRTPLLRFSETTTLVETTHEVNDNVIPSSNAIMAENLWRLSIHLARPEWRKKSEAMCQSMHGEIQRHPRAYSYWLRLIMAQQAPASEIVVVGEKAFEWIKDLQQLPLQNIHWAATTQESDLPLFQHRYQAGKTLIYICQNQQCNAPIDALTTAKEMLWEQFLAPWYKNL